MLVFSRRFINGDTVASGLLLTATMTALLGLGCGTLSDDSEATDPTSSGGASSPSGSGGSSPAGGTSSMGTGADSSGAGGTSDPPCERSAYGFDGDGDGVGTYHPQDPEKRYQLLCETDPVPAGWYPVDSEHNDCDDTDPTVHFESCLDHDGDKHCASHERSCVGELPAEHIAWTASTWPPDCDDDDPTIAYPVFEDSDGDGRGSEVEICAPEQDTPGTATFDDDCDDTDPRRAPNFPEQWADAVDSDCDGKLDPLCTPDDDCTCGAVLSGTVPLAGNCTGPDLTWLSEIEFCLGCPNLDDTITFVKLGNVGNAPLTGEVILSRQYEWEDSPTPFAWLSLNLAPGETSGPIHIDSPEGVRLELQADTDCFAGNDALEGIGDPRPNCTVP